MVGFARRSRPCRADGRAAVVRLALAALVGLAAALAAPCARAEQTLRLRLDWSEVAEAVRSGGALLLTEQRWRSEAPEAPARGPDGTVPLVARTTLVARDWGGATLLWGSASPTDQFRLSRSTRMILGRLRVPIGRFTPFAQVGLGQWRIDPDLFPACRRDIESAGQLGGGLEVALARSAVVAFEADYTILYREQHEPQMVDDPHHWGAFAAARWVF